MAIFRPDPIVYLTGQLSGTPRPPAITEPEGGGKFTPEGAVLPYPGNTIVCHIAPGPVMDALIRMQDGLKAGPLAGAFTYLPPPSFHMTVFQGISGREPEPEYWPKGVPEGTSRGEVSKILLDRIAGLDLPATRRIRPVDLFCGHSVTVEGADDAAEAALRDTRDRLSQATGIRDPRFDTYTFHITLAYLTRWLTEDEARQILDLSDRLTAAFLADVPEIVLGPLEFCEFETMHHFEPIKTL